MGKISTSTGSIAYAKYQLRRSILESSLENDYSETDHEEALDYFGGCAFCGNKNTSRMDHLVPVISLGDFIRTNVVPSCQVCDDSKGQKDYQEWMRNATSPKALVNRGFSKQAIEQRIKMIEKWRSGYIPKTEKQLFRKHYNHYLDILNKMDVLCSEARALVAEVKPKMNTQIRQKVGTIADKIRKYIIENYIKPARLKKGKAITIRAGEIHSRMGLRQNHANVCQVLRGVAFQHQANVKLVSETGPSAGGNTYFRYRL